MTRKEKQVLLNTFASTINAANELCLKHGIDDPEKATEENLSKVVEDEDFDNLANEFLKDFGKLVMSDVNFTFELTEGGHMSFKLTDPDIVVITQDDFYMVENLCFGNDGIVPVLLLGTTLNTPKEFEYGVFRFTTDRLWAFHRKGFKYDPRHIIWTMKYRNDVTSYVPDENGDFLPEFNVDGEYEPIMVTGADGNPVQLSVNVVSSKGNLSGQSWDSTFSEYRSQFMIRAIGHDEKEHLYGAIQERENDISQKGEYVTSIGYKNQYTVRCLY